jgi:hypothetical protein
MGQVLLCLLACHMHAVHDRDLQVSMQAYRQCATTNIKALPGHASQQAGRMSVNWSCKQYPVLCSPLAPVLLALRPRSPLSPGKSAAASAAAAAAAGVLLAGVL